MAFVKKIKVYSFERNDKVVTDFTEGGMTYAINFSQPVEAEIDTLEQQIKFLKASGVIVGPRRLFIIYSFSYREEWFDYEDELADFLKSDTEEEPSEPDETFFMLPSDLYTEDGEKK